VFKGRSVIEIMVLVFTFVVAFAIIGLGVLIVVVEAVNPEADTGVIANTLSTLVSGILGALLGVLAGRASMNGGKKDDLHERPDGSSDELGKP
jgi:hypothetical protein